MGADAVEPDLVPTRDGVLVCRHESELSATTDVADHPALATRRTTKDVDGAAVTGWFTEDLTSAELRALRARERLPDLRPDSAAWRDEPIATFEEVVELADRLGGERGRPLGLYPELKHPTYFRALGLGLEEPLVAVLRRHGLDDIGAPVQRRHGLDDRDAPVLVQSFDRDSLQRLRRELGVPLVQLLAEPADLEEVAASADVVGLAKEMLVPRAPDGTSLPATEVVGEAHAAGLRVLAWTFRAENAFLPRELRSSDEPAQHGELAAELEQFLSLGVDGVLCDQPDVAVAVRDARG